MFLNLLAIIALATATNQTLSPTPTCIPRIYNGYKEGCPKTGLGSSMIDGSTFGVAFAAAGMVFIICVACYFARKTRR
jgi:hypothetical protein